MKMLTSWGCYPDHPQAPQRVHWRSELSQSLGHLGATVGTTLAFGNGRSYGDSCLAVSDRVLHLRSLDRLISADWERGVLVVEPGITLGEILALSIPRGWFLKVTPGTQFVTVGGAIANDVHGKNHHRQGTFGCHVPRFGLVRSDQGSLVCSADENADLYRASIGGLGLTGIIEWAELYLQRIEASWIASISERFGSLGEFMALSRDLDPKHEFSVAWIDCVAKGPSAGRGVFMAGDFAREGGLDLPRKRRLTVPLTPPFSLINRVSLSAFNEVYWRKHPKTRMERVEHYEPFFYPLDSILHWNRIYGRRGFQQYQCVLPEAAAESGIREMLNAIAKTGRGSFLAVLKRFGDRASPGLLSFPRPGLTLALDFPNRAGLEEALFSRLDAIVREANGRMFPAKDAHMAPEDFQRSYPQWEQLETLRDPLLNSRFWRRVTR